MHRYPKILSSKDVRGQDVFFLALYTILTGEGCKSFPSWWYGIMRPKNSGYKKGGSCFYLFVGC